MGACVKTFSVTVWPAKSMEDMQVYEVEIDCNWWCLTQRVHLDDLEAAVADGVRACLNNTDPLA